MRNSLKACVGVMILHENNVLLGFHKSGRAWRMPGGWQEIPETMAQAAIRETYEETGINLIESKLQALPTYIEYREGLVIPFIYRFENYKEARVKEPDTFSAWAWFDLACLPVELFTPTRQIIEFYLKGQK